MRLWRGLGTRIVASSVLCGLLGLSVAWALMLHATRDAVQSAFAPYIHRTFDTAELRRCERSPQTWALQLERSARLDAYDESTQLSRNPSSPPLDLDLYRRLVSGEAAPAAIHRLGAERGVLLLRGADSGPCSLIQATLPSRSPLHRRSFDLMILGALVVMVLAAGLGVVAVVGPVTRRIDRLRTAAGKVGRAGEYASASDLGSDELGELSTILDQAHARIRTDAEALESRQEDLERHLADVAHDLRTPIASLQIALAQAAERSSDPVLVELLRGSIRDVVYLAGLTANLRLAYQLRDGWNPGALGSSVDLGELAERVVARVRYFARNRGMSLEVARPDGPIVVTCHPTAAEQALTNLVENAVAYGNPGGHVAVVLEAGTRGFSLVVADDGPGVLPSELPRLGERTFRSDEARQRDPSGSGLGLAIASEVCAHCGWSLAFERIEPRGLSVVIRGAVAA